MAPDFVKTPIQKFNTPGQVASGPFGGIRRGKFDSNLIQIGDVTYGSSKVLDEKFAEIPVGTYVSVTYKGLFYPPVRVVNGVNHQGKPYKTYDINPGNNIVTVPLGLSGHIAVETDREDTTDYAAVAMSNEEVGDLTYTLLLSRVKAQKGEQIANVLKAATGLSNDPVEALRSAMSQMGMKDA